MDLIDRQAAIDALGERPMVWVDDDDYALGERNQYDSDKLAIETVPSAQPEQRWIPCSERLPEESNIYLCCNIVGDVYMHRWTMPFYFKKEGAWMDMYDDYPEEITDVVAWMPLPKPYRKEGEQE